MLGQRYSTLVLALLFIAIYGSGFVGAKLGLLYSQPFSFLGIRFAFAGILLAIVTWILKLRWPQSLGWVLLSGLLIQGVFSVGVFYAVYLGMAPAVSALIIALQPLLVTVLAGFYLGEIVYWPRWVGLLIGLVGVVLVIADGLVAKGISWVTLTCAVLGLLGLSFGQLIQKKYCADMHVISGGAIQLLGIAPLMMLGGWLMESQSIQWQGEFLGALLWMSVGVSLGAVTLLYILIGRQSAAQVASLFYGIPVAAALVAWLLFDEVPTLVESGGFVVVVLGITLSNWPTKRAGQKG